MTAPMNTLINEEINIIKDLVGSATRLSTGRIKDEWSHAFDSRGNKIEDPKSFPNNMSDHQRRILKLFILYKKLQLLNF
jgi:hypothetical protein